MNDRYKTRNIGLATPADAEAIDRIMRLTVQSLENRDWFFDDDIDFIRRHIDGREGYTLTYRVDGKMAGFLIIRYPGSAKDNLGRYLDLPEEQLPIVAHMESVCVLPQYRGRHIFQQLMEEALRRERAKGQTRYFMCTAHPDNRFSVDNLTQIGFRVVKTIRKYDSWLRHVLVLDMEQVAHIGG